MKLINMYQKSQRNRITQNCIVYARKRAIEWLGKSAWHQCDDSCQHVEACEKCKYYLEDEEIGIGVPENTCLLEK